MPRAAIPLATSSLALGTLAAAATVATLAAALHLLIPGTVATRVVFLLILTFAIAYGIARAMSGYVGSLPRALTAAVGVVLAGLVLHLVSGYLLPLPAAPPVPAWLAIFIATAFIALFIFQSLLWRASRHRIGQQLYVHALSGFYVGTLANRFLNRLWPSKSSQ